MSAKKFIILGVAVILAALFWGLETTHSDFRDPPYISMDLSIYGRYVGSDVESPPYELPGRTIGALAYLGNWKYHLMAAAVLIGLILCINGKKTGGCSSSARRSVK